MKEISAHIGRDRYQTTLTSARHSMVSDEPIENAGKDLGPSPHELLLMSLASCTAITLRMYADRKQLDIDAFDVTVSSEKTGDTYVFTSGIRVTGTITEEQRLKLLRIAGACPVHKALTHPIEINTTLV